MIRLSGGKDLVDILNNGLRGEVDFTGSVIYWGDINGDVDPNLKIKVVGDFSLSLRKDKYLLTSSREKDKTNIFFYKDRDREVEFRGDTVIIPLQFPKGNTLEISDLSNIRY